MTKLFSILTLTLILLTSTSINSIKPDKKRVEEAVISWADSTFFQHEEYRFEQYYADYTEPYQIALLRFEMYQGKQVHLEKTKQKGYYKKSDSDYEKEHIDLVKKNAELKTILKNFKLKANSYQILFWSNIKTNQGPTVYYSHLIALNNDFKVVSVEIKSQIGKKNNATKILYKKGVKKQK
jgi:hypothetical protein